MIAAAAGILSFLHRIGRQIVSHALRLIRFLQACRQVLALIIDVGIDLVGELARANIFFKSGIVRGRTDPNRFIVPGKREGTSLRFGRPSRIFDPLRGRATRVLDSLPRFGSVPVMGGYAPNSILRIAPVEFDAGTFRNTDLICRVTIATQLVGRDVPNNTDVGSACFGRRVFRHRSKVARIPRISQNRGQCVPIPSQNA